MIEIWGDTETGVNYVFHRNRNAAVFTSLLDKDGKTDHQIAFNTI